MKTMIVILSLAGTIGPCFGQGIVNWLSFTATAITVQTNTTQYYAEGSTGGGVSGNTAPANVGLIYYYELLYNTDFTGSQMPSPDYFNLFNGSWLDTGLIATNNNVAGRLSPVNPSAAATVPWASGVTNNIMLVGWSSNLGTNWLTVSYRLANWNTTGSSEVAGTGNAFFGESLTGFLTPASGGPGPGPLVFSTSPTANGLPIDSPNMQLDLMPVTLPVPEPTTIALAGLGGLSLLLFRRRKV